MYNSDNVFSEFSASLSLFIMDDYRPFFSEDSYCPAVKVSSCSKMSTTSLMLPCRGQQGAPENSRPSGRPALETRGERADNASSAAAAALRLQLRADTCAHAASRLQPLHRSAHRRSAQRRQSESKNAGDGGGIVARQSTLHVGGWFTLTGAEGRGCARCKRQPAHAVVELNARHGAALRRGVRSCGG